MFRELQGAQVLVWWDSTAAISRPYFITNAEKMLAWLWRSQQGDARRHRDPDRRHMIAEDVGIKLENVTLEMPGRSLFIRPPTALYPQRLFAVDLLTALYLERPSAVGPMNERYAPDCGRRRNATVAPGGVIQRCDNSLTL
jgi:hypothetical protein